MFQMRIGPVQVVSEVIVLTHRCLKRAVNVTSSRTFAGVCNYDVSIFSNFRMEEACGSESQPQLVQVSEFYVVKSQRLRPSVLIIPTGTLTCRRFNLTRTSADARTQYYTCKRCSHLSRRQTTEDRRYSVMAYVTDGCLYLRPEDLHHPNCKEMLQADVLAQNIDRRMREEVKLFGVDAKEAFEKVAARRRQSKVLMDTCFRR